MLARSKVLATLRRIKLAAMIVPLLYLYDIDKSCVAWL